MDETVNVVVHKAASSLGYHHLKKKQRSMQCTVRGGVAFPRDMAYPLFMFCCLKLLTF